MNHQETKDAATQRVFVNHEETEVGGGGGFRSGQ